MKKYKFIDNLKYMLKIHWNFNKKFLILLLIIPLLSICISILEILFPKVVLDGLSNDTYSNLLLKILIISFAIIYIKVAHTGFNNKIEKYSWEFFFLYGQEKVNRKKMTVNYQFYSSADGKNIAEKAFYAVCGNPDGSMVSFFPKLKDLIFNCLGIFTFSAILCTLNPLVIVFLLLSYIFDAIIAVFVEKRRNEHRCEEIAIWRKINYLSQNTTLSTYAKDIRIYNLRSWLNDIRKGLLEKQIKLTNKKESLNVLQLLVEGVLVFIRDGFVYIYLIQRMMNDNITLGQFTVYFAAIAGFGNWLQNIVICMQNLMRANDNVAFFREFMEASDGKLDGLKFEDVSNYLIKLQNVSYQYPGSESNVINDVNLEIKSGETLGIVGINGAGKTTLIKILCGLIKPTTGKIFIGNHEMNEFATDEYYKFFSAVFQESCLMPVSIEQNISLTHEKANKEFVEKCIEQVGLSQKVNSLKNGMHTVLGRQFNIDAIELSGGEAQKLLLARALYKNAPILILDEPTSAMDPVSESKLYQKYHDLLDGKTSIFISHRLSSTTFCDKIAVLDNSRIIEYGTHEELMQKNGQYAQMYRISVKDYNEVINDVGEYK